MTRLIWGMKADCVMIPKREKHHPAAMSTKTWMPGRIGCGDGCVLAGLPTRRDSWLSKPSTHGRNNSYACTRLLCALGVLASCRQRPLRRGCRCDVRGLATQPALVAEIIVANKIAYQHSLRLGKSTWRIRAVACRERLLKRCRAASLELRPSGPRQEKKISLI